MAGFKGHLLFGVAAATTYTCSLILLTDLSINTLSTVFFLTSFSAVLPDIDSHSGIPAQIIFSILSLSTTIALFNHYRFNGYISFTEAAYSIIIGLLVYPALKTIFKYTTVHRGALHSIPMAFILGLICATILNTQNITNAEKLIISTSITLGYLCHLLLDELVSIMVKSSLYLKPKKSFGTALKLTANSSVSTAFTYITLCSLVFMNKSFIKYIIKLFL